MDSTNVTAGSITTHFWKAFSQQWTSQWWPELWWFSFWQPPCLSFWNWRQGLVSLFMINLSIRWTFCANSQMVFFFFVTLAHISFVCVYIVKHEFCKFRQAYKISALSLTKTYQCQMGASSLMLFFLPYAKLVSLED